VQLDVLGHLPGLGGGRRAVVELRVGRRLGERRVETVAVTDARVRGAWHVADVRRRAPARAPQVADARPGGETVAVVDACGTAFGLPGAAELEVDQ
jgi:hypothetical protein